MRPARRRGQLAWFELRGGREAGHQTQFDVTVWCATVDAVSAGLPDRVTGDGDVPRAVSGVQAAQRLPSQGCWSRTMAKAIRLARWAMAVTMTPPGLPRLGARRRRRAAGWFFVPETEAEIDKRDPERDRAFAGDVPVAAVTGGLIEPRGEPGGSIDLPR